MRKKGPRIKNHRGKTISGKSKKIPIKKEFGKIVHEKTFHLKRMIGKLTERSCCCFFFIITLETFEIIS